ncbi:MAG TPA: GGDEF domain-containing protein, partial [Rhodocyclaceae bacterium]|nr:GGDEF domain-containing protein [Rhodocyclaceae bacterium]
MAVLIADVDSFKLYNDYYGHLAGDECLKAVAQALSRQLRRPSDFLARYGGEEFAAVLPNTDTEGVTRLAEAMCQAVRDLSMPHLGTEPSGSVTVSIGVAAALPQPGTSSQAIKALLARADTALYSAKRLGRDQVAVAEADDATKLVGQAD